MKIRWVVLASLTVMLMLPTVIFAQAMTPEEVVMALIEADKTNDVEAGVALFADDAVYTAGPLTPLDMTGPTIVGKDAIRAYWEAIVAKHVEVTREITGVEGNTVTTLSRYVDDDLRSLGLEFTEGTEELVVQNGKITNYTYTKSDESVAEVMAALPPQTMPESGGDGFPTDVVLMAIGGVAISVGLGLTLLHRRSF
ncbi:MAG: nuclear transport factor 2 family protein [Anaerolineae bacterium]